MENYNQTYKIYSKCGSCVKRCKVSGIGEMRHCPDYRRQGLISDALKSAATAALFLLLTVGIVQAEEQWNPQMFLLRNPPIKVSQAAPVQIEVNDRALTEKECIPSPWVLTDQRTGERSGVILDTIFTPGDDKGAGTCQYLVKFPSMDKPQIMITLSLSERLKRQSEGK